MPKNKEKFKRSLLSVRIPEQSHEKLRKYSEENGVLMKRVVELALTEYIERHSPPHHADGA